MPLILPGNVGSATAATGFNVANSCMFGNPEDGASATDYLTITPGSASNRRTFTISYWVKRGTLNPANTFQQVIGQQASNYFRVGFGSNEQGNIFRMYGRGNFEFRTKRFALDIAAWYHVCLAIDTTQGTAANRAKLYINGVQQTEFYTENYPDQNTELDYNLASAHVIGRSGTSGDDAFNGYLAQFVSIDGSALAADQFGEFDSDSGIWKPIDVSGLTFGTNGFFLDFADSGDLGDDESGNGNDFTETGIDATNQSTDTCTNNFATLNSVDTYYSGATFSQGNLLQVSSTHSGSSSGQASPVPSTIGVSSGKWYAEIKYVSTAEHDYGRPGITSNQTGPGDSTAVLGHLPGSYGMFYSGGNIYNGNGGTATSYGSTIHTGDIVGIYMDLDNNKLYFSDNGSLISATGISITAPASTNLGAYFFGHSDESRNTATNAWNFGGCPAFAISSSVSDDNGYGSFEYSPNITGDSEAKKFYSLCTKNLAEFG